MPEPNQRGMGRGLAAILPQSHRDETGLREIAVELIRPNAQQPRKEFGGESLIALAESIKARGILQPLVVRPLPGGEYELIAGERRLRAAKMAEARAGAGARARHRGVRPARARADREHGARGPEPGRGGARLRDARRGPRHHEGGAGPAPRSQPRRDLEPDPAARAAGRGARASRGGRAERGPRPRAAHVQGPRRAAAARAFGRRAGVVGARDRAPRQGVGQGAGGGEGADRPAPRPRRGDRRWPRTPSPRHSDVRCA